LERIVNNKFENLLFTIGVDFKILNIESKYGIIKLIIWNCAGQERFRSNVQNYFKGSHCIILEYVITNKESYEYNKKSCYDFIIDNLNKEYSIFFPFAKDKASLF